MVVLGFAVVARLLLASVANHGATELSPLKAANVSVRMEDAGLVGSASSEYAKATPSPRIETLWAHADETDGGSSRWSDRQRRTDRQTERDRERDSDRDASDLSRMARSLVLLRSGHHI